MVKQLLVQLCPLPARLLLLCAFSIALCAAAAAGPQVEQPQLLGWLTLLFSRERLPAASVRRSQLRGAAAAAAAQVMQPQLLIVHPTVFWRAPTCCFCAPFTIAWCCSCCSSSGYATLTADSSPSFFLASAYLLLLCAIHNCVVVQLLQQLRICNPNCLDGFGLLFSGERLPAASVLHPQLRRAAAAAAAQNMQPQLPGWFS
jgi:hypothetical protein